MEPDEWQTPSTAAGELRDVGEVLHSPAPLVGCVGLEKSHMPQPDESITLL